MDEDGEEEPVEVVERILPMEEIRDNLIAACQDGDMELAADMIEKWKKGEHGPSPVEANEAAWTPMIWAVSEGYVDLVDLLLANKMGDMYLHASGEEDSTQQMATPLQWAAFKGHDKIVNTLLRFGMQVQDTDDCGNNALHLACTGGHIEVIRTLLAAGCDINARNKYGNTPIGMCSPKDCKGLLHKAMNQLNCHFDNSPFDATNWKYLCTSCEFFFHSYNTATQEIKREVGSNVVRMVRLCQPCENDIRKKQSDVETTMEPEEGWKIVVDKMKEDDALQELEPLDSAVIALDHVGGRCGDVDMIYNGRKLHTTLTGSVKLKAAMKLVEKERPLPDGRGVKKLTVAIDQAKKMRAGADMLDEARKLVTVALLEVNLQRTMFPLKYVDVAGAEHAKDMTKVDDALKAIKEEGTEATETEIFKEADKLFEKLTTEVALQSQMSKLRSKIQEREDEDKAREAKLAEIETLKGKNKKKALKDLKAEEDEVTSAQVQAKIDSLFLLKTSLAFGVETGKEINANERLILEVEGEGGLQWIEMVVEKGCPEQENAEWPNGKIPEMVPMEQVVKEKAEVEEKAAAKAAKKAAKSAKANKVSPAPAAPETPGP
jgi:hypothetical protein